MTLETAGVFTGEKQHLAAFCRIGYGIRIVAVSIPIVRRIHGDQSPFKCSEGLRDIVDGIRGSVAGKRLWKQFSINGIAGNYAKKLNFVSFKTKLDRFRAEH